MGRGTRIVVALASLALLAPGFALAAFPGSDPAESPRANAPNDPEFDRCEPDDPDTPHGDCSTYFEEEFGAFGFSPDSANELPGVPHAVGATSYDDCSQLDEQGREANLASGSPECAQIAGVRADSAWKYSPGDPGVVIAILDTGIRWHERELIAKVHLNPAELPEPQADRNQPLGGGKPCDQFGSGDDADGDGAFSVLDFACDSRVEVAAGDDTSDTTGGTQADELLDPSDLIATFSDGSDADANGYVDDIAGWDLFDDDNDPYDASSCCSANGHGSGRASEAAAETNNGEDGIGLCPECQLMPLRVWDTFVVPTDYFAMGVLYAANNGASVVEGAVGGLTNTRFARRAFRYADRRGLAQMLVSSDINSANHNYPTNYNEAVYVAGSMPDTAPNDTCSGPGGLPGLGDVPGAGSIPGFAEGCQQLLALLAESGVTPTAQPVTTSFFRNSNLTQYGGKADIVLMGSTGSVNTGQAAGAAGLLASYGREVFGPGDPLSGNEIRQLLTMTAEDVLPQNTGEVGQPDKANPGWDPHFGYGRVNLAAAMERIRQRRIPPEAQLDAPDWFSPINVDRLSRAGVPVHGRAAAPHSVAGVGSWEVDYACGQDALDSDFRPLPGVSGRGPVDGKLGRIPRALLRRLARECDGSVSNDAGRPSGALTDPWPADPYPDPDPERHAFQIRLTVHEAGDEANIGRYRKTLFAYEDDGNLGGWPRPVGSGSDARRYATGSGGEASTRFYDVDGDNELDVVIPTSSGELHVLHADGKPVEEFNRGRPVRTRRYALERNHPAVARGLPSPRESLRVPAIGDIDGDTEAEIVVTAGEHVYAWHLDGRRVEGFPVGVDRSLSDPCKPGAPHPCLEPDQRAITSDNHIKRGFVGSPALADLERGGGLEIVAGALDQHLYAWSGSGRELQGFPVKLSSEGADGAEIVTSPAIAQLDGGGRPEVVIATNEVAPGDPDPPANLFDLFNAFVSAATGANPVYAVHADGSMVDGWPVGVGVLAGDLLPLVLPGHDAAVLDEDGDGDDEVSVSAATSVMPGGARLVDGDGSTLTSYGNGAANTLDQGPIINLADYQSIGDLSGSGNPAVLKGGLTENGAANLLAVNQNLPFAHVEQAWDPSTGDPLPGYPRATDDFQLLSQAAVARVGSGRARQALLGTGLYQLHAYGPNGSEPEGWPKFTGGWLQVTPAVGDADGDGDLDVSALSREGWSFLWDTGVDACEGSNKEWWTFHHDEHSSANYGHDARPPGAPERLRAKRSKHGRGSGRKARRSTRSIRLSWRAPGDDWLCGKARRFRLLVSRKPIDEPEDGRALKVRQRRVGSGERVRLRLRRPRQLHAGRHFAVLYRDEAGNWGHLATTRLRRGSTKR